MILFFIGFIIIITIYKHHYELVFINKHTPDVITFLSMITFFYLCIYEIKHHWS